LEATAGAAPATGAGTGSVQSGSPSSTNKASNSASQTSPAQRQSGAAQPSSTVDGQGLRERSAQGEQQAAQTSDDSDPEFDFGNGKKAKRSQVLSDINRIRKEQSETAKRASEVQKRYDAQVAALAKAGIKEKDAERFLADPEGYMRERHHDYVRRQIEEAELDPRELEMRRREETLKERETRLEREAQERQQFEHQQAVQARTNEYASEMHDVLAASDLPRNPQMVARLATLMLAAARTGQRVPKEQLGKILQQQVAQERQYEAQSLRQNPQALVSTFKSYLSDVTLDGAQIADFLGEQHTEALRKHLLQNHQSKFNGQPATPQRPRAPKIFESSSHPNGYHTLDEYNEMKRKQGRK